MASASGSACIGVKDGKCFCGGIWNEMPDGSSYRQWDGGKLKMRKYRMGFREKRLLLGLVLTGISGMMGMHTASAAVLAEVTGNHVTIAGNTALGPNGTLAANLYYPGAGQPQATESGDLYVHDNSVTVSGRTVYTAVSGVQVVPSFALSDDGSVRGLVRIENNAATVENSNTSGGAVYAVHDLRDCQEFCVFSLAHHILL